MFMGDFFEGGEAAPVDRRGLPRIISPPRLMAAVDNLTRHEMLGTAEVVDFSCLGLAVRGLPGDPVAATGDRLWVSLIAEEGIIPLTAKLVHIRRDGLMGLKVDTPSEAGQHFLLRVYERAARPAHVSRPLDAV